MLEYFLKPLLALNIKKYRKGKNVLHNCFRTALSVYGEVPESLMEAFKKFNVEVVYETEITAIKVINFLGDGIPSVVILADPLEYLVIYGIFDDGFLVFNPEKRFKVRLKDEDFGRVIHLFIFDKQ